jgi:hypothetical protein
MRGIWAWWGGAGWRGWKLGHMDPDFIDLQPEGNGAELDHLTGSDLLLRDRFIVDEGAVCGLKVPDDDTLLIQADFGMKGRNGGLVDDDVVRWIATNGVQAAPEVEPEWHEEATKMVEVHTPVPESFGSILDGLHGQVTERFRLGDAECRRWDGGVACPGAATRCSPSESLRCTE